jgi:hypothetical protein
MRSNRSLQHVFRCCPASNGFGFFMHRCSRTLQHGQERICANLKNLSSGKIIPGKIFFRFLPAIFAAVMGPARILESRDQDRRIGRCFSKAIRSRYLSMTFQILIRHIQPSTRSTAIIVLASRSRSQKIPTRLPYRAIFWCNQWEYRPLFEKSGQRSIFDRRPLFAFGLDPA